MKSKMNMLSVPYPLQTLLPAEKILQKGVIFWFTNARSGGLLLSFGYEARVRASVLGTFDLYHKYLEHTFYETWWLYKESARHGKKPPRIHSETEEL